MDRVGGGYKRKQLLTAQAAVSGPREGTGELGWAPLGWDGWDKAAGGWEVGRWQKDSLSNLALGEKCDRGGLRQPHPTHRSPTHPVPKRRGQTGPPQASKNSPEVSLQKNYSRLGSDGRNVEAEKKGEHSH